jgi:hypothetical protein
VEAKQRRRAGKGLEAIHRLCRIVTTALSPDTDPMHQDVRLVWRPGIGRLAQHRLETVGQVDPEALPVEPHGHRRQCQEPVARRIETAAFHVQHKPALRVGRGRLPAQG